MSTLDHFPLLVIQTSLPVIKAYVSTLILLASCAVSIPKHPSSRHIEATTNH